MGINDDSLKKRILPNYDDEEAEYLISRNSNRILLGSAGSASENASNGVNGIESVREKLRSKKNMVTLEVTKVNNT